MKRTVALALMGLGVAAVNTAIAQNGNVAVWNYYVSPYNQVLWDASTPGVGGTAMNDTGVVLTFWAAPGAGQPEGALVEVAGSDFAVNPAITFGGGGYYDQQIVVLPGVGDFTIQIRASGTSGLGDVDTVLSRSGLFDVTTTDAGTPALDSGQSIGLNVVVPEPTTFALAGLGAAALLIFRRRS